MVQNTPTERSSEQRIYNLIKELQASQTPVILPSVNTGVSTTGRGSGGSGGNTQRLFFLPPVRHKIDNVTMDADGTSSGSINPTSSSIIVTSNGMDCVSKRLELM